MKMNEVEIREADAGWQNSVLNPKQNTTQAAPKPAAPAPAAPAPAAVTSAGASGPPGSFQRGAGIAAATANAARPNATTDPRSTLSPDSGAQARAGAVGSAAAGNTARAPVAPGTPNTNLARPGAPAGATQAATTTPGAAPAAAAAAPAQQGYQSKNKAFADKVNQAAAASGLKDMNKIQPGQKIKMPDGSEHVVQKGETLSGIIAGKKAAPTPAAPTPAAPTPAAPTTSAPNSGSAYTGPAGDADNGPTTQAASTTALPTSDRAESDARKAAELASLSPEDQKKIGNADPTDYFIRQRIDGKVPYNPASFAPGDDVKSGNGSLKTSDGSSVKTSSDAELQWRQANPRQPLPSKEKMAADNARDIQNREKGKEFWGNLFKESTQELNAIRKLSELQELTEAPAPTQPSTQFESIESNMELNQLRKFSGLPELTESEVTVHKGTYGNSYGKEDVRDQYGHKIGKVNKGADGKKDAPKRGRGRPTKGDKDEHGNDTKFDTSGLQGMLGGKPKGEVGKKSVKHSLKDWIEAVSDNVINEADGEGKTMSRAAKGHEKYGKEGMQALAKAGRDGASEKKLDTIRNKYDKYDTVEEAKDLPGKQDKLDVAEPKGKLTSADFKALGKKKVKESLSFNEMMSETNIDMQDMLQELQQDIEHYNNTGHCSDKLEAFLKIHGHTKKRITDEEAGAGRGHVNPPAVNPNKPAPSMKPENGMGRIVQGTWQSDPRGTVKAPSGDPEGVKEAGSFIRNLASTRRAFEGKNMKDMQVETWKSTLNELINENLTISTTIDDQGHDSVNVSATEGNAQEIIELLRNAGLGGMGGGKQEHGQKVNNYGLPMSNDEHSGPEAQLIAVGDPHAGDSMGDAGGDDMMALIKKMTGIQDSGEEGHEEQGSHDYEEEEGGEEEHGHEKNEEDSEELSELRAEYPSGSTDFNTGEVKTTGGTNEGEMEEGNLFTGNLAKAREQGKSQADLDGDGDMEKVDEGHGETCNECGSSMYEGHACGSEPLEEFANSADDTADQDLEYMMKTISGGLNGQKRDQSTAPIIKVVTAEGTLMKDSTDLLSDFRKLSGI